MSNIDKYETRKKMVYDFMCDDMYVPMKIKELCIVLGVKKEDRPQLEQILLDLQAEGRITLSKRGKYSKSEIKKTVGVFTAHQRGFGFVTVVYFVVGIRFSQEMMADDCTSVTVEGEPDDIFIPAEYVNGAMHMDTVEITISPVTTGRRKEGKVVSVIERGMKQVVCTYEASDNFGFAVPDNTRFGTDIFIPLERSKGAVNGHTVVVEITQYGKKGKNPEGKVVERLLMPTVVIVVAPGPRCKCHWYSMQKGRTAISGGCGMVSSAIRYTTYPAGKDVCLQTTPTISVLKRVKNLTR
mgnify:CR=1 FL=1